MVDAYNSLDSIQKARFDNLRVLRRTLVPLEDLSETEELALEVRDKFKGAVHTSEELPGIALYQISSLINHGCRPNAYLTSFTRSSNNTTGYIQLAVLRGEEITFSYADKVEFLPYSKQRRAISDSKLAFECVCSSCMGPPSSAPINDVRRTLIAHLTFLVNKKPSPYASDPTALDNLSRSILEVFIPNADLRKVALHFLLDNLLASEGLESIAYLKRAIVVKRDLMASTFVYALRRILKGVMPERFFRALRQYKRELNTLHADLARFGGAAECDRKLAEAAFIMSRIPASG